MASIKVVCDEIMAIVRADVPGLRGAPDEPPDKIALFPFAIAYPQSGTFTIGPPDTKHGIHSIVLEVHLARRDLARTFAATVPYVDSVPKALYDAYRQSGHPLRDAIAVLNKIPYELGPMGWAGVDTFGIRFRLEGVKTEDPLG